MKKIIFLLALALSVASASGKAPEKDFIVGAYVHLTWIKADYDFERLSHVDRIYCFGLIPDEEGKFVVTQKYLKNLESVLKVVRPDQELILSIGGGAVKSVKNMNVMGSDPEKRKAYAKELVNFSKKYPFAGIDVDWEGSGPLKIKVDTDDLTDFLKLIRKYQKRSRKLTISLSRRKDCALQAKAIERYVDDISVMIYSRVEKKDRELAPMWAFEEALGYFSAQGLPNSKLLPGVPFYGIHQSNADGKPRINRDYRLIEPTIPAGDSVSTVSPDGYAFNSPEVMKQKVKWLKENGYKGIMIWELSQDTEYSNERSLLRAINEQ